MGKKEIVKEKISSALSLPKEVVMDIPLISITGNIELNIENYKGVVEYTDERIRVNTASGVLRIEGRKLLLKQITAESIQITGKLIKLEYLV